MTASDLSPEIKDMRHQIIDELVAAHIPEKAYAEQWDLDGLSNQLKAIFGQDLTAIIGLRKKGLRMKKS